MGGLEMLDVAIGMTFLFTMVALSASTLRELIESRLKTRAIMIEQGIRELLADRSGKSITQELYRHPQIAALFVGEYKASVLTRPFFRSGYQGKGGPRYLLPDSEKRIAFNSTLPCYIPTRNFALALLDYTARGAIDPSGKVPTGTEPLSIEAIRAGSASLPNDAVRRLVLNALDHADNSVEGAVKAIGETYDSVMDRVTGWYKRQTQKILFAIGLILAVLLNIDSLAIMQRLSVDDVWRNAVVESAIQASPPAKRAATEGTVRANASALSDELDKHGFFSGKRPEFRDGSIWRAMPGWLITALAAALGAPFWFDLLGKLVTVRSTLKPKSEAEKEAKSIARTIESDMAAAPSPPPGSTSSDAVVQSDFVPHRWNSGDPQGGVL